MRCYVRTALFASDGKLGLSIECNRADDPPNPYLGLSVRWALPGCQVIFRVSLKREGSKCSITWISCRRVLAAKIQKTRRTLRGWRQPRSVLRVLWAFCGSTPFVRT